MGKEKVLYCPLCSRKLGIHDGKSEIGKVINCRNCNKQIYFKNGNVAKISNIPKRNTSSGMTFH